MIIIGGLEKLSLIDFPEHIAAVVFLQSCNFRCRFCYNTTLVLPNEEENPHFLSEEDFFLFLKDRIKKLDGVVISGGEPTLQKDLKDFIVKIKEMGFKVKLDTNGSRPDVLKELLKDNLIDYIAMDFKASFDKYEEIIGVEIDLTRIKESINIIKKSEIPYEFRTTLIPGIHKEEDIIKMAKELGKVDKWFIQKFKSDIDLIDENLKNKETFSDQELHEIAKKIREIAGNCEFRE
jgi:pyruvate formate lyase activating enzyme